MGDGPVIIGLSDEEAPPECHHGITFDEVEFRWACNMSSEEVRRRWPRLFGPCPLNCGYSGIYYASYLHYIAGDW